MIALLASINDSIASIFLVGILIGGALLAQIGGMSFLVSFTAYHASIITAYGYNVAICLISLTLLCSPLWIIAAERLVSYRYP